MKIICVVTTTLLLCFLLIVPFAIAQPPKDIMLVLDNSGSMRQNDPQLLTKKVVSDFVARLSADTQIGIVIFDEKADLTLPLSTAGTDDTKRSIAATLDKLNYSGKLTDSPAGIERGLYELKSKGRNDASKIIVFMTDGIVDTGNKAKDLERAKWLREELAAQSQRLGIRIFGIAFTDQADYQLIQALGEKTGGGYFRALKADEIPRIFQEIDTSIQSTLQKPQAASIPVEQKPTIPRSIIILGFVVIGGIVIAIMMFKKNKDNDGGTTGSRSQSNSIKLPKAQIKDIREVSGKADYLINSPSFNIGRAADNDIVINNTTVSTRHATITYHDNAFFLVDQRSTNGTFVNGQKITGELKLKHNDRIGFDQFEFAFVMEAYSDDMKTQLRGAVVQDSKSGHDDDEEATRLKDMCSNHPSWRATELCPDCKTAFCDKCIIEHKGRKVCRGCAEKDA